MLLIDKFKEFCEIRLFGVLSALGDSMGIAGSRIRMFFIYITFLGIGSPIVIYLAVAFVINIGKYIRRRRRNPVWDY